MEDEVRCVAREDTCRDRGEDFSPRATHSLGSAIDFTDAVVAELAVEYLERLARGGKDTNDVWMWRRQLQGR